MFKHIGLISNYQIEKYVVSLLVLLTDSSKTKIVNEIVTNIGV